MLHYLSSLPPLLILLVDRTSLIDRLDQATQLTITALMLSFRVSASVM